MPQFDDWSVGALVDAVNYEIDLVEELEALGRQVEEKAKQLVQFHQSVFEATNNEDCKDMAHSIVDLKVGADMAFGNTRRFRESATNYLMYLSPGGGG
jgi:DNA-binding FadR family transcriptional regulator